MDEPEAVSFEDEQLTEVGEQIQEPVQSVRIDFEDFLFDCRYLNRKFSFAYTF